MAEVCKNLLCKGIALFTEFTWVLGELLIHAPPDAVPEVGVRLFKEGKVRLPPQEEVVLVLPAPPGGLAVEDAVRFLRRPAGDPGQESLAPGAWAAHDGVEEAGIEKAVDVLAPFASDVGVVLQAHAVRDGGGDGEAGVRQDLHEDPAAVGDAVEDIGLSAIVLHKMIPQALGLVHGGAELRLRLVGVEAVVSHHMVDPGHLLGRRQHPPVAGAAAVEHHHELRVLLAKLKVLHASPFRAVTQSQPFPFWWTWMS